MRMWSVTFRSVSGSDSVLFPIGGAPQRRKRFDGGNGTSNGDSSISTSKKTNAKGDYDTS